MRSYSGRVRWVYARSPIYAFHAKLPIPPELAVITPKRFWSGQITREAIIETCNRYKPELVVLPASARNSEWQPVLGRSYEVVNNDGKNALYVTKELAILGNSR